MQGQIIYEYGKNPINYGRLENPTFSYTEKNHTCGEYLTIDFIVEEDVIKEIAFEGDGRMVGIASMSLLSEVLEDERFEKVEGYGKEEILKLLEVDSLTPKRMRSAMLPVLTLRNAFRAFQKKDEKLDFGDILPDEYL